MGAEGKIEQQEPLGIGHRVKRAVMWRSGSQVLGQILTWGATFLVIRMLEPSDYGLFAMTQVVLVFLNLMNGWGFANSLVRDDDLTPQKIRQAFGMLILLNGSLCVAQLILAPVAAAYFHQPVLADLLRVQALLYISTPFTAVPSALLSREMNFKSQAQVDLVAAALSAGTMVTLAYLGYGVWTLVFGGLVLFWGRAIGLLLRTRWLVLPSFRFRGAGAMFRYGGAMVLVQFFWFVQSQSDVFIAGRMLSAHELGLYTTALFLTQIVTAKFLPPLNEVAFAAYSRIQDDREAVGSSFLKSVRLIMLIALPFYLGFAATAEPLVLTMLGEKWRETIPLAWVLALAMPFVTLQLLLRPATNALGRPGVALAIAGTGAVILPIAFMVGMQGGTGGLAAAWLIACPIHLVLSAWLALPVIGVSGRAVARAVLPALAASSLMAVLVLAIDSMLPAMPVAARFAILVSSGGAAYAAFLFLFAREVIQEALGLVRSRPAAAAQAF